MTSITMESEPVASSDTLLIPTPPPPPILSSLDIKPDCLVPSELIISDTESLGHSISCEDILPSAVGELTNGSQENKESNSILKKKEKFKKMLEKKKMLRKRKRSSSTEPPVPKNAVMALNEYQKKIEYIVVSTNGPPHACDYTLAVTVNDKKFTATAPQKKLAKHKVAELALEYLKEKGLYTGEYIKMSELLEVRNPIRDACDYEGPIKKKRENGLNTSENALAIINRMYPGLNWEFSDQIGPVHSPTFTVSLSLEGKVFIGSGGSKQKAKLNVAEQVLETFPVKTHKPPQNHYSHFVSPKHQPSPSKAASIRHPPLAHPPYHHHPSMKPFLNQDPLPQFDIPPRVASLGSPRMLPKPRMFQNTIPRMQSFSQRMPLNPSSRLLQPGSPRSHQLGLRMNQLGHPRMSSTSVSPNNGMPKPYSSPPTGPLRNIRPSSMMGPRSFNSCHRFGFGQNDCSNSRSPQFYNMTPSYPTAYSRMAYQRSSQMSPYNHNN